MGGSEGGWSYFSSHVLPVQSAYILAAGSELARNPTSSGLRPSAPSDDFTSDSSDLATEAARTTLHVAGGGEGERVGSDIVSGIWESRMSIEMRVLLRCGQRALDDLRRKKFLVFSVVGLSVEPRHFCATNMSFDCVRHLLETSHRAM